MITTTPKWYRDQIMGLFLILDDADNKDFMITREYVKEKLTMILQETGINFHPAITERLNKRFCPYCGKNLMHVKIKR